MCVKKLGLKHTLCCSGDGNVSTCSIADVVICGIKRPKDVIFA